MKSDGTWEVVTFPTLNPWERREASEVREGRGREREERRENVEIVKRKVAHVQTPLHPGGTIYDY
jgi:hypothetical protein